MANKETKSKSGKPAGTAELRRTVLRVVASNPTPMRPPVLLEAVCRLKLKCAEEDARAAIWGLLDEGKLVLDSGLKIAKAS